MTGKNTMEAYVKHFRARSLEYQAQTLEDLKATAARYDLVIQTCPQYDNATKWIEVDRQETGFESSVFVLGMFGTLEEAKAFIKGYISAYARGIGYRPGKRLELK
jgi:hypothetical protein